MKSYYVQVLVVISAFLSLAGCGNGGNGSQGMGVGSTVRLESSVKSGSSVIGSTSVSSPYSLAGMDFTLTSVALSTTNGTFVASSVSVPTYEVSYTYEENSNPYDTNTYPIPGFTLAAGGGILAGGGTLTYTGLPMIQPAVKTYLLDHYSSAINCSPSYRARTNFTNYSSNLFRYTAVVKFNGVENSTNKALTTTTNVTLYVTR